LHVASARGSCAAGLRSVQRWLGRDFHAQPLLAPTQRVPASRSGWSPCRRCLRAVTSGTAAASQGSEALPEAADVAAHLQLNVLGPWRRRSGELRVWGDAGPEGGVSAAELQLLQRLLEQMGDDQPQTLAEWGVRVLSTADPLGKAALTHYAVSRFLNTAPVYYQHLHESAAPPVPLGTALAPARPARPQKPELVPIKQVPTHSQSGLPLNCYLLHTLTHIELNAVDLAWDTVVRFSNIAGDVEAFGERGVVPMQLFVDFLRVADDESRHLGWCLQRLDELGVQYGSIPAHDMLWQGAYDSRDSLAARLAVVPCVQEARGLDAGPRLTTRLNSNNDHRTADIVDRISEEELPHVAVGVFWFREACAALEVPAGEAFQALVSEYCPLLKGNGPFNHKARADAGMQREWYDWSPSGGADSEGAAKNKEAVRELHRRLELLVHMEHTSASH